MSNPAVRDVRKTDYEKGYDKGLAAGIIEGFAMAKSQALKIIEEGNNRNLMSTHQVNQLSKITDRIELL